MGKITVTKIHPRLKYAEVVWSPHERNVYGNRREYKE